MIPDGVATLFAFFGLVAPGLVLQLVTERREPRPDETAFREASRVALSSVVFTAISLLVLIGLYAVVPDAFPDLVAWESEGWAYVAHHPLAVLATLLSSVGLACGLAALAGWWLTRGSTATLTAHGAWYQTLRVERPDNTRPWVHLRLKDDAEFWGHLRHYTEDDAAPVREIVLGGPALAWKPRGSQEPPERIGDKWDAVAANAEDVVLLRIAYQELTESGSPPRFRLRGRRSKDEPAGRLLS